MRVCLKGKFKLGKGAAKTIVKNAKIEAKRLDAYFHFFIKLECPRFS